LLLPEESSKLQNALYPGLGVVVGFAAVFLVAFIWNLFWAPYRQRDEARKNLVELEETTHPELDMTIGDSEEFEKLDFPTEEPRMSTVPDLPPDPYIGFNKLIRVTNNSATEAKRCRVRITDMVPTFRHIALPIRLTWFGQDSEEIDIEPFGHAYAVLIRTVTKGNVFVTDPIPLSTHPSVVITVVAWPEGRSECSRRYQVQQPKPGEGKYHIVSELSD